jgi:tetratricopeptide (TPR) repeat protein
MGQIFSSSCPCALSDENIEINFAEEESYQGSGDVAQSLLNTKSPLSLTSASQNAGQRGLPSTGELEDENEFAPRVSTRLSVSIQMSLKPNKVFCPNELDPNYFRQLGVRVRFLEEFINACTGGREGIADFTTTAICERIVKPFTEPYKLSFCDLLHQSGHPGIGQATVFISHAWKYKFVDVVDALQRKFADALDTVVWFDVFSVNQHTTSQRDFGWWSGTFQERIRQFGHTVMVLSPWQDPVPLTRAWCLWELYCTVVTGCKFEVAFSEREEAAFVESVDYNSLNSMKSKIDVERSECWLEQDRERIFAAIKEKTTFSHVDTTVFKGLCDGLTRYLADMNSKMPGNADWLFKEASLLEYCGELSRAEEVYNQCLTIRREALGPKHESTMLNMSNLAGVLKNQGKYEEAKALYSDCLVIQWEVLGPRHPDTLTILNNLALVLIEQSEYAEAEKIYEECLDIAKEALGLQHPGTLMTMSNLALVLDYQGKYEEAKAMYSECLQIQMDVLGSRHPDTLTTMNNLASVLRDAGNYEEGKAMYSECLAISLEVLGPRHPDTLTTQNGLALLYQKQSRYAEAKKLYEECLVIRREVLGETHPSTLATRHNLSSFSVSGKVC